MDHRFDVFVSYNTADREFVSRVVEKLTGRRMRVWVDYSEIPPGRVSLVEAIGAGIRDSGAIAVFIGPSDVGQWQRPEINIAIAARIERQIPVISLILPGVSKQAIKALPPFLTQDRYIQFKDGAEDEKAFYNLVWGITGVKPPPVEEPAEPPAEARAPSDAVGEAVCVLADLLRSQNITYFLGPGATYGAVPPPVQTYQLARGLLTKLQIEGASSSELLPPVDVAGMYYAVKAGDPSLDEWVTSHVGDTTRVFPAAYERLASLLKLLSERPTPRSGGREPQLIVTTTFDLITERALLRRGLPFTRVVQHRSGQKIVVNRYDGVELRDDGTIRLPPEKGGGVPVRADPEDFEGLDLVISNYGKTEYGPAEVISRRDVGGPVGGLSLPTTPPLILYKYLGSQDVPNSCVVSTRHHFEFARSVLQHNPVPPLITSIIGNSTRLLIGLWLMDPDFRLTYYTLLRDAFEHRNDKRYALQLAPHHFAEDVYRRVESRLWDEIKDEGHSEMGIKTLEVSADDFLRRLEEKAREVLRPGA